MRVLLPILMLSVACESSDPVEPADCGEPSYGGEASDEAWYAMIDAYQLATTGGDANTFAVPSEGEILTGETPPALTWSSPLGLSCPLFCNPGGFMLPLSTADRGLVFAPAARAHLPPVTGAIHYLEVFVPGRECPITTITTLEDWRPTLAEWAELRNKGQLRLVSTSAYLEKNRIAEGPYRSIRTFQVQ